MPWEMWIGLLLFFSPLLVVVEQEFLRWLDDKRRLPFDPARDFDFGRTIMATDDEGGLWGSGSL